MHTKCHRGQCGQDPNADNAGCGEEKLFFQIIDQTYPKLSSRGKKQNGRPISKKKAETDFQTKIQAREMKETRQTDETEDKRAETTAKRRQKQTMPINARGPEEHR